MCVAIFPFSDVSDKDNFIFESSIFPPYLTSEKSCALSGVLFSRSGSMKKERWMGRGTGMELKALHSWFWERRNGK